MSLTSENTAYFQLAIENVFSLEMQGQGLETSSLKLRQL